MGPTTPAAAGLFSGGLRNYPRSNRRCQAMILAKRLERAALRRFASRMPVLFWSFTINWRGLNLCVILSVFV
jgi:hypothetical protein